MRPQRPPSRRRPLHQRSASETNEQVPSTIRLLTPSEGKNSRPPTSSSGPIEDEAGIVSDGVSARSHRSLSKTRPRSAPRRPGGVHLDDAPGPHDRWEPVPGSDKVTREAFSQVNANRHQDERNGGARLYQPDTTGQSLRVVSPVALPHTAITRPSSELLGVNNDAQSARLSQRGSSIYSTDSPRTSMVEPLSVQMRSTRPARRSTASYSAFPPVSPPPIQVNLPPPVPYPRGDHKGGGGGGGGGAAPGGPSSRVGVRPLVTPRGPRPLQWRQSASSGTIPTVHDDKIAQAPVTSQARWSGAPDGVRTNESVEGDSRWMQRGSAMQRESIMSRDSMVQRESMVIPDGVGLAVTSSPDVSRISLADTRRGSTIRVVSGPLGIDEASWPITAEVRPSPSAEIPLRMPAAAFTRPPPTRESMVSSVFPDWARYGYTTFLLVYILQIAY